MYYFAVELFACKRWEWCILAGAVSFVLLLVRVLSCFKYPYANSEDFYDDDLAKRQEHCR